MTVPSFLQSSFFFNQDFNVTDVSTIITSLTTILTTQTPAWTSPSAGVFKSPVDAAGRFMTITLVATTALRLSWVVTDQNNVVVCSREIDIDGTPGDTVNYYSGQYHLYVETLRGGTPEWAGAFMIDPDPYALNSLQNYVMGNAFRSAGGSVDGQASQFDQWFMLENGVSTVRNRCRGWTVDTSNTVIGLNDFQGNIQVFPQNIAGVPSVNTVWLGNSYQTYVTASSVSYGTTKQVAVDNSTLAFFRVTVAGSDQAMRLMIRVG